MPHKDWIWCGAYMKSIIRKIVIRITPALWRFDINRLIRGNHKITNGEKAKRASGRVALVRLDAIGDFIIWLDSARQFREHFADKTLILVCNKACVRIAEESGLFDEIIPIDTGRLNYAGNFSFRKQLVRELNEVCVELLIQTAFTRRVYTDVVASAIAASKKITIRDTSFDNAAKWALDKTDRIYNEVIDTGGKPGQIMMELRRNAEFTRLVTGSSFKSSVPRFDPVNIDKALIPDGDYFVVFPGGSFKAKMWPMDRFAAAAQYIHDKTGWKCCVCGSPDEKHLAKALADNYSGDVIDMTGKTSLIESIEIIRHAKFLIGNDTSGIHFAAAVGTKALCVFGGWHYGRFLPYDVEDDKGREVPYVCVSERPCFNCHIINKSKECRSHMKKTGLFTCVDEVSVEQVKKALDRIL